MRRILSDKHITEDAVPRSEENLDSGVKEQRRRLLKASAAAPLIATLSPRYVMAQASVACDQKDNNFKPVAFVDDSALRAMAHEYVKKSNSSMKYYMVGDSAFAENGRSVPRWFKMDGAVTTEVEDPRNRSGKIPGYVDNGPCYVLCYVDVDRDEKGQVESVVISSFHPESVEGANGVSISDSCWASLNPIDEVVDLNR